MRDVDFTDHDFIVLSLTLQHELERLKKEAEKKADPKHIAHDLRHNTIGAARSVLSILRKVNEKAATNWVKYHGSPSDW